MIKLTDDKMGSREFVSIILLAIGLKFTDSTPGYLYMTGANATWLVPFFYLFIIGIPFLLIIIIDKKTSDRINRTHFSPYREIRRIFD